MNWKRVSRLLICLLLVCVILVNCSPIKAKAVEPVTVMIGASIVIASVLIGLGIMMGSDPIVFDELVQKVAQDDEVSKKISVNFELPVIKYNATTGGLDPDKTGWAVGWTLIEAIRQVLFEEKVVSEESLPDGYVSYNGCVLPVLPVGYDNILIYYTPSDDTYWSCSSNKTIVTYEGWYGVMGSGCYYEKYKLLSGNSSWTRVDGGGPYSGSTFKWRGDDYSFIWCNHDIFLSLTGGEIGEVVHVGSDPVIDSLSVVDGLTAGEIAPQEQELSEGYSDWFSGSIFDENADEYWFPIGIGQTYDETKSYTQGQVQSGEGTYQEESSGTEGDSDTVTASGLKKWISDFKSSVDMWFARVSLNVSNTYDAVTEGFSSLRQGIAAIPDAIVGGITSVLESLFVPSGDFVTDKFNDLRAEFAFVDTLITGGQMIGDAFNGFDTSPPIIYIDLGATRGDYDIGGKVPFIDLTWYEEYKPTVDVLLSSLLWVIFLWNTYQSLSGIISGMPGPTVSTSLAPLMDINIRPALTGDVWKGYKDFEKSSRRRKR